MAKIPIIMLNVKRESSLKENEENNRKEGTEKMETEKIDESEDQRERIIWEKMKRQREEKM